MRPPVFLFDLARKERQRRARWKKEKGAPKNRYVPAPRHPRMASLTLAALPGRQTASRGEMRGMIPVRSITERQRYAWPAAARTCYRGDRCFALRLPVSARGQGNCGTPLPVADAGGTQFPQPRHWRAVVKQAREWHSRQGGRKTVSFLNRKEMGFAMSSLSLANR